MAGGEPPLTPEPLRPPPEPLRTAAGDQPGDGDAGAGAADAAGVSGDPGMVPGVQQPAAAEGDTPPAEGEEAAAPVVAEPVRRPLTDAEMETIRAPVKDAVGFDPARGDTLTVTSAPFQITKIEALPELPIWEQPWFMALAKQGVAALIVLSLIFFVLRPMVGSLVEKPEPEAETEGGEELSVEEQVEQAIRERDEILDGTMPPSYEDRLQAAQEIVQNNNELATGVLKSWTSGPGEEEEV